MIYFISDTHFGHANIVKMCERPYPDVEAMNEALITAWNERVHGDDTVYIIGDMFFRCSDPESILKRLKGKKWLIVGNHDGSWMDKVDLNHYFVSVDNYLETTDGVHGMTICHYPLLAWKNAGRTYMVHGHIHADINSDYWPLIQRRERVLNAGVDVNDYRPVTFEEMVENNRKFKSAHAGQDCAHNADETAKN